jgi:hypothetical protein
MLDAAEMRVWQQPAMHKQHVHMFVKVCCCIRFVVVGFMPTELAMYTEIATCDLYVRVLPV